MKLINRHGSSFILVLAIAAVNGCGQEVAHPPHRPNNVPQNAVWGGGVDGGNWYLCRPSKEKWNYHCRIYADDGSFVRDGEYALTSYFWDSNKGAAVYQDMNSINPVYDAYDGNEIFLKNSLILTPKKK